MTETTYLIQYPVSLFLSPAVYISSHLQNVRHTTHNTPRSHPVLVGCPRFFFFLSQLGTNQFY